VGLTEEPVMGIRSWFRERFTADGSPRLWRLVSPPGRPNRRLDEIKKAAAADVAAMEAEDREWFRRDGPGEREDDL
jgi:hypothetical protein